ncbi:Serine/threonine-protein kinase plo1 [Sphaceloma murrayae]|uniref:Serine/threonine-protein kinase plo1 n=1 Tax=Sphaceloma murrayae TaxID=2082308 RepID=A0A2K1QPS8_9PEZI|nr:Serine/threonine-protein kinase plo1 [Sphaceloma murrayae]
MSCAQFGLALEQCCNVAGIAVYFAYCWVKQVFEAGHVVFEGGYFSGWYVRIEEVEFAVLMMMKRAPWRFIPSSWIDWDHEEDVGYELAENSMAVEEKTERRSVGEEKDEDDRSVMMFKGRVD